MTDDTTDTRAEATISLPSDTELVIEREFDAPPELVFRAMSQPEHIRRWYGPRSMTMTVCEMDLRPGGAWRFAHADADGREFAFSGEIREVSPPERMVFTEEFEALPGTGYVVTATLEDLGDRTRLRSHLQYQTKEHRDGHLGSGMESGLQESYQRLDEVLAALA